MNTKNIYVTVLSIIGIILLIFLGKKGFYLILISMGAVPGFAYAEPIKQFAAQIWRLIPHGRSFWSELKELICSKWKSGTIGIITLLVIGVIVWFLGFIAVLIGIIGIGVVIGVLVRTGFDLLRDLAAQYSFSDLPSQGGKWMRGIKSLMSKWKVKS